MARSTIFDDLPRETSSCESGLVTKKSTNATIKAGVRTATAGDDDDENGNFIIAVHHDKIPNKI